MHSAIATKNSATQTLEIY